MNDCSSDCRWTASLMASASSSFPALIADRASSSVSHSKLVRYRPSPTCLLVTRPGTVPLVCLGRGVPGASRTLGLGAFFERSRATLQPTPLTLQALPERAPLWAP